MISSQLPDGSARKVPGPVTVAEVAASIGAGLAKAALGTPLKRPENGQFRPESGFREFFFDETGDTREAVGYGVGRTAGIITGAAAIMVCVFAGMASGRLVMFQQMGFGLAVAILIDATVVRTIIVPAAMELLGD